MANKRQLQIDGTGRTEIPDIEEAAEDFRALRDKRMAIAVKENEAKAKLIQKMEQHNLENYIYEDEDGAERKVSIVDKRNAKVAKVKRDSGDGDGGDDAAPPSDDVQLQ